MINKLEALCQFNALLYVENWVSSSIGADAAYNDLKLWHDMTCKHDPQVANAAMKTLERHFWYLTEECAAFSLFQTGFPLQKDSRLLEHCSEFLDQDSLKGAIQRFLF